MRTSTWSVARHLGQRCWPLQVLDPVRWSLFRQVRQFLLGMKVWIFLDSAWMQPFRIYVLVSEKALASLRVLKVNLIARGFSRIPSTLCLRKWWASRVGRSSYSLFLKVSIAVSRVSGSKKINMLFGSWLMKMVR